MKPRRILPPAYFYITILVMILLAFLFPVMKIVPSPWNALGVIFLIAGIVLELSGDRLFHQAGTTIKPYEESSALVRDGVFRISRNPMYLGFVFLLFGGAIIASALTPFLVIPAFILIIENLFIRTEERMLAAKFGQDYLDYKNKVRRWI